MDMNMQLNTIDTNYVRIEKSTKDVENSGGPQLIPTMRLQPPIPTQAIGLQQEDSEEDSTVLPHVVVGGLSMRNACCIVSVATGLATVFTVVLVVIHDSLYPSDCRLDLGQWALTGWMLSSVVCWTVVAGVCLGDCFS